MAAHILWARQHLPENSLLAIPPSPQAEKALFFTRRSGYFWIGPIFAHPDPALYRQRLRQLYGVDPLEGAAAWQALFRTGATHLYQLALQQPDSLRTWGITHLIGPSSWCLPYPKLWSGPTLSLWEVKEKFAHAQR